MKKNFLKVTMSIIIAGLLIPATPIPVSALDHNVLDGDIVNLSALSIGDQVVVAEETSVTLTGTGTGIQVICSTGSSLNLDNVSITNSAIGSSPILFTGDGCNLDFTGINSLVAGRNAAGINTSNAEITINGTGTLNVNGGIAGAAIGGGNGEPGGVITINGGVLTATSGLAGAGIGGGASGNGGTTTINGGTITAKTITDRTRRETCGAGIGGGSRANGGMITINGGMVTVSSEVEGSGIGGGYVGDGGTITINGGTVNATGGYNAAGIGGGSYRTGGEITITGGIVNAKGGTNDGSGIGGGHLGDCGNISISGGTVLGTGVGFGAGIGNKYSTLGAITLSGGVIYCVGGGPGYDLTGGALTIRDTAAVFLRNDSSNTPVTSHSHATYSAISTLDGIDIPSGWTTFGTYLNYSTISYDLNLGTGVTPGSVTQRAGTTTTAAAIGSSIRAGFIFSGWNTESDGNGGEYAPGGIFTIGSEDTTLYAQWGAPASDATGNHNRDRERPGSATVFIDGKPENSGRTELSNVGGKNVATVTIDDKKMLERLNSEDNKATVSIPISGNAEVREGILNGQTVKEMEKKETVLEIRTDTASYTLPAAEIDIDSITAQFPQTVDLQDIKVKIRIASAVPDIAKIVEDTANKNNYKIVANPVEFEITCTSGNKTVSVSRFNGYVERTVVIPDGVDSSKITTGIVLNADGTFSHVPTTIVKIDGKYYAKINSLTNSTYSVIYNPVEFADVARHWAKDSINDMGSRLIVSGSGNGNYSPNKEITRAEFAAIVIRALGLKTETAKNRFTDVKTSAWYAGYVETAVSYGIITGYSNGKFGPNDKIAREQAMTMIARAMKLTGLYSTLTEAEMSAQISSYVDGVSSSKYAKEGIAACLKTGVVSGKSSGKLAPKDYITRAEVAVIIERMLEKSELI
ncbi:MAG TPA: S-layer homology domain-containing protein [Anaerovoracaceae bacterium]|nr:S-layer homology domain-containing protein [Anaerovoracaceae bacterium]